MPASERAPDYLKLVAFIGAIVLIGFATGILSNPKASYASFVKPSFSPPAWLFGPVWTILYIMIGIVGWRLSERDPASTEMKLWWVQMVLNFIWTPVFFMAAQRGVALGIIVALLVVIAALARRLWHGDRTAALLFLPYVAWVGFASLLNAEIVRLN
ncbi:MAG: tryptophan-rich sensory protein [Proteobacteria bacterium]|nr:tryptophan-rich sensory protein [Pseudomonadota bacterium]